MADVGGIAAGFHARVARMVRCNVAMGDGQGRSRSRLLHPVWEGATGWIGTWRTSVRAGHPPPSPKMALLARTPQASLADVGEPLRPVSVDGRAEIVEGREGKTCCCAPTRSFPLPCGSDPAAFLGGADDPRFGVLRIVPPRIALVDVPAPPGTVLVWRA